MSTSARRRLLRDFKRLQNDPPSGVSGAPMDTNIMVWQAVIFGPDDTPWEGGTFKLLLEFTEDYPNKAPSVRFLTKMFHPNIYADGQICLDILQNQWSPIYDISAILTSIQSLLCDPNPASPANSEASRLFNENRREYNRRVKEIVEMSWVDDLKRAICAAFVPSHKHQLFPISDHLNHRVPIFDDKKLINGNYIQRTINTDPQISDFSGDSFQEVVNQLENYFSTDNNTGTTKYIRPKDTIGIGAIIAPAVRNEFNFDDSYTGVAKFAIVLLQSTEYELNFPSPSLDRKRLRELLLPGMLKKIDGIRSFCDAQDVVNEIGCAYLHNATFGKIEKFSTCSKQKPKMSSKKMARELHIKARLHGQMTGDNTIVDFKLAPISNLANSTSKQEGLLELAIIEYCMKIFEPYKKFCAFAPVRNNLAVAKDIQRSCDCILINSIQGGFLDRSFLMIANRKVLAVLNDIILMVKTVDDTTCLRLRQSKKSGSNDDEEERVESIFFEDLTEPELKAYLLSLVSSLRQENASATHSSIPYIKYFRRFRRRKRRNFREITARYLKEMSDMCRDEESIVRATFHKQEIRFNSMRDQERYNDIAVDKFEHHSGTT